MRGMVYLRDFDSKIDRRIYRAVYYERVSTMHDEQTNSMENQRSLCEGYLKNHPEICLAEPIETYSERVSGKSDMRPKYTQMMERIKRGDIDYILVKDLKRLNRSTEVAAQLRRMANQYNFKLVLLSTGQIYDPNSENNRLIYGFESLTNEEVVYRQSEYGRIAHRQKMEAKRLNANNCTFGYEWDKEKSDMVINEEKAEIIRDLFDLYVFNNYSIKELRIYLAERGYHYTAITVRKWLRETAYIGIFHMNKKGSELGVGSGQKTKRFMNPEEEWVAVERPDLAIVDRKIFELAKKIRISRQKVYDSDKNGIQQTRFQGRHLFASKIFCAECGRPYVHEWANRKKTVGIYRDSFNRKSHNALENCQNVKCHKLYESDMQEIVLSAINGLIQKNRECFELLFSVLEQSIRNTNLHDGEIKKMAKEIEKLKEKRDKTKDAFIEASGMLKTALAEDYENVCLQLESAEEKYLKVSAEGGGEEEIIARMQKIKKALEFIEPIETLDRKTIDIFVKRIVVSKDGTVKVIMSSDGICNFYIPDLVKQKSKERNPQQGSAFERFGGIDYNFSKEKYENVVKMVTRCMTEASVPAMPTAPMTRSAAWRPWSLWGWNCLCRPYGGRLPPVLT